MQKTNQTSQKPSFSKILTAPNIERTTHTGSILKISLNQSLKNTTINKKREVRKDDKKKIENTKVLPKQSFSINAETEIKTASTAKDKLILWLLVCLFIVGVCIIIILILTVSYCTKGSIREPICYVSYNSHLASRPLPKEPDRKARESASTGKNISSDDNVTIVYEDLEQCSDWRKRQRTKINTVNFQQTDFNELSSFPKLSPPALPIRT